jgi:imidazolonepropionase-like amidohydrolase
MAHLAWLLNRCFCLLAFASGAYLLAGTEQPGTPQQQTIVLTNATVHTVTRGTLSDSWIIFDRGIITYIGVPTQLPANAEVIDCKGASVYPGFIATSSTLGLTEIDAVRSTRDAAEVGVFNPNVTASSAYNPDSELIPTVRSNGVLIANVVPEGGIVSGASSVMQLDGWTREDIALLHRSAMIVDWPTMIPSGASTNVKDQEQEQKSIDERLKSIQRFFADAYSYYARSVSGVPAPNLDRRFQAMRDIFSGTIPLIVKADGREQMLAALQLADVYNLRVHFLGGKDARAITNELVSRRAGVMIQRVHALPYREEDPYDAAYTLASDLSKAGVLVAVTESGSWQQRNLPYNMGTAIAYGLSQADAERMVTINPAIMLGVDSLVGSLDVGKHATLFVCNGNAFTPQGNIVSHAFIQGKKVDLENRHVKLAKKYRARYRSK